MKPAYNCWPNASTLRTKWPSLTFAAPKLVPPVVTPQPYPASRGGETAQVAHRELPPDFHRRLPPKFFGHDQLRKRITKSLGKPGLIVLHATGGMGKTAFAAQVARDAHAAHKFPGGAVWIDCEERPNFERCMEKLAETSSPIQTKTASP